MKLYLRRRLLEPSPTPATEQKPPTHFLCDLFPHVALRRARSSSFHRLKLDRQVFHSWLYDFLVIAIGHLDRVGVRAGFEPDVVLLGQSFVLVSRQTVEIAKRR